jgi:hypothetical protein
MIRQRKKGKELDKKIWLLGQSQGFLEEKTDRILKWWRGIMAR